MRNQWRDRSDWRPPPGQRNGGANFAGIAVDRGLCQNVQPSADLETELAECSMMSPCGCCWWKMIPEFCVSS